MKHPRIFAYRGDVLFRISDKDEITIEPGVTKELLAAVLVECNAQAEEWRKRSMKVMDILKEDNGAFQKGR